MAIAPWFKDRQQSELSCSGKRAWFLEFFPFIKNTVLAGGYICIVQSKRLAAQAYIQYLATKSEPSRLFKMAEI
ncbi:MAG: hypothetical protein CVU39_10045 [Chloroflexi bacterium HGW-Chloroflexi-10]|nr:MAG: hypothetical protein CVU39_10045 [Chloroflexi bacterium HGW-Chloroflexi-10]